MTEAEICIAQGKKALLDIFDSIEVGKTYSFELKLRLNSTFSRRKNYEVLSKKKHDDWSYSVFCRAECGGVIYHWIVPQYSSISERISAVYPVEESQNNSVASRICAIIQTYTEGVSNV